MFETVVSSSSNITDKAIDKYHDSTSYSGSSSSTSNSSSGANTTSEEYMSGVPGVPLEVLQEQLRTRAASVSRADTSTSVPPSILLDEVEIVYSCAISILSKTSEQRLTSLRTWYQIPDDLNPRLAVRGEWYYNPHFRIGIYEAYLLGGLRLPP